MADNRLANPCIILHTLCVVSYKLAGEYFGDLSSFLPSKLCCTVLYQDLISAARRARIVLRTICKSFEPTVSTSTVLKCDQACQYIITSLAPTLKNYFR